MATKCRPTKYSGHPEPVESTNWMSPAQDLLADLLYYYEAGKVYCARDYAAKANIPRCAACDELIFAAEYTGES